MVQDWNASINDSDITAEAPDAFLIHNSEMARRIQAHDWASTPLGPIASWPQSLRTAVQIMLAMPQSASVCWGKELCQLYNDRYARYLGSRHPFALGRPLLQTWPELSDMLEPAIERLFQEGVALEYVDRELHLAGHGEDPAITWVTGGWTPLKDSEGRIQGFLSTTIDTTNHVLALRALRQSEERQAYLLKLSDALRPLADPELIQREASRVLREQLKADRVAYFEVEGGHQSVVARGEDHRPTDQPFLGVRFRFSDFEPNAPELLTRGSTQWRDDINLEASLSQRQKAAYARVGIRSWMFTSLVKEGRPVACLGAFFDQEHKWRGEEQLLMEETAERTWAAVEKARAEAALHKSEARLAADLAGMRRLYELHARLAAETDLKAALDEILAAASAFTGTHRGCIQLVSDDGRRLEVFAWRGYSDDSTFIQRLRREALASEGESLVRAHRRRSVVEDWAAFDGLDPELAAIFRAENIAASQSTPMISRKGETIGVLSTQFSHPHHPSEEELRLIDLLAWSAADFVERHRALAGREAALAALSHQSRFLEATLSSVPALVYAFDRDRRFVYTNTAMHAFFGRTAEELRGKTLADFNMSRELQSRLEGYMDHIFATGETVEDQVYYTAPSGNSAFFQFTWGPMRASDGSVQWVVGASLDTTERRRLEERQRLLVNELNHRVKNTLATVQSMAAQALRGAHNTSEAQEIFDSRLVALSKAHDILTQRSWEGASLRRIVDNVAPHSGQGMERFEICGPDLQVSPKYALALALALHELCTNAIKYGALSNTEGKVEIAWSLITDGNGEQLRIDWREKGGPLVQPPKRRGFGSRLLGRGLKHDLGGSVQIDYAPSGVVCSITAPWAPLAQAGRQP